MGFLFLQRVLRALACSVRSHLTRMTKYAVPHGINIFCVLFDKLSQQWGRHPLPIERLFQSSFIPSHNQTTQSTHFQETKITSLHRSPPSWRNTKGWESWRLRYTRTWNAKSHESRSCLADSCVCKAPWCSGRTPKHSQTGVIIALHKRHEWLQWLYHLSGISLFRLPS